MRKRGKRGAHKLTVDAKRAMYDRDMIAIIGVQVVVVVVMTGYEGK